MGAIKEVIAAIMSWTNVEINK